MTKRVAVNCADMALGSGRSIGIYNLTMGLLGALVRFEPQVSLVVLGNSSCGKDVPAGLDLVRADHVIKGKLQRVFWEQWQLAGVTNSLGVDSLLLPKGMTPVLRRTHARSVAIIHDAMLRHYTRRYPGYFPRVDAMYTMKGFASSVRNSAVLITDTEFGRSEIASWAAEMGLKCPEIVVGGCGFEHLVNDGDRVAEKSKMGVLLVTGEAPHKLAVQTISLLNRWQDKSLYYGPITVLGRLPREAPLPKKPGWTNLTGLSNREVRERMAGSQIVVYASEYEGFGMPPVEAVVLGATAVYSAIPALTEVMGDCGLAFVNGDVRSFFAAMDAAMCVTPSTVLVWRDRLMERHSWLKVAKRVAEVLC